MALDRETLERQERVRGQMDRLRWLITIRWVAVGGVALASLTTELVGYSMLILPPWILAPFALGYNTLFHLWLRRTRQRQPTWSLERLERSLHWQGQLQAILDMVTMILLVYLDGGVEYPLYYAPLLAIMLSCLLLPRTGLFLQANIGAALFAVMALADHQGWIPHIDFLQPSYQQALLYRDARYVMAIILSTAAMLNLTAFLMSSLAQRLNRAETEVRTLLGRLRQQVGEVAGRLAGETDVMRHTADEVARVAEQVAVTVQEIAQGATRQAGQLDGLSRNLEHLADTAHRTAEGTRETHQASEEAVAAADLGRQAAQTAGSRIEEIAQVFGETEQALSVLGRRSEEIAEVALAIDRFAERTDLLSLNAGIEAARAGEHGRGFAVVAGEVKKLAASSSASAEQVAEQVAQIQNEITGAVRAVAAGMERVHHGRDAIVTLQEALDRITTVIARTDELAATMEHLSRQQLDSHRQMMRAVEEIASTAEETAAGAEETAAAVEEQAASFTEFGLTVQDLATMATGLNQAVTRLYQTEEGRGDSVEEPPQPEAGG